MLSQFMLAARIISVCCAQHLLRRAHPIDGIAKSASSAREAGSHFVRKHLFALCRKSQGRFLNMGLCPIPHIKRRFRMESTSPAPSFYCWNSACHARLIERQSPSRPRTPLHPIDGNVEAFAPCLKSALDLPRDPPYSGRALILANFLGYPLGVSAIFS